MYARELGSCPLTIFDGSSVDAMPESVIISCAITGSIHTPTMSEHMPITPRQIAAEAIAAARAGAAILHLHARDPKTGKPTADRT